MISLQFQNIEDLSKLDSKFIKYKGENWYIQLPTSKGNGYDIKHRKQNLKTKW